MSDPILFLEEGFISREAAQAVDSISHSASFERTLYRIQDFRINARMRMGPFFEAQFFLCASGLE